MAEAFSLQRPEARRCTLSSTELKRVGCISDDIRSALNLPKDIQGVVIADVDPDSPAAKASLREGDVIQEGNKQPAKSAKNLVAISKKLKSKEKILMRVYSQGRSSYVALEAN